MSTSQANGGTRSGLLWEIERILQECHDLGYESMPQILIMENVPQVHSSKDLPYFVKWIERLYELGYTSYYEDLNATNYGIPQNRERCFMISILNSKDGKEHKYNFPKSIERKLSFKDLLENNVDENYYLSPKMIDYLVGINQLESRCNRTNIFMKNIKTNKEIAYTITTMSGQRATDNFIIEGDTTKINYISIRKGDEIRYIPNLHELRIRKLTEKECMRLMGFQDKDVDNMKQAGLTKTAIIHCAGDSIVATVLIAVFAKLYGLNNNEIEMIINNYINTIKEE